LFMPLGLLGLMLGRPFRPFGEALGESAEARPEVAVGRTGHMALTAFTNGCSGAFLADTGLTTAPFPDWFHIGVRLQHLNKSPTL
jgi:hypothetical protein